MLTPNALPFMPGGRTLQRLRSALQRQIRQEPAVRLLPGLLELPLCPAPLPEPKAILAAPGGIALCGPPTAGRSLALLQIQARWAAVGGEGLPLYLALSAEDAPNLSPRAVVAGAIHRAGLPVSYAEGERPWILLLDDWEDLPADRRALWRGYVLAAQRWRSARVVIALPEAAAWPDLLCLSMAPPSDEALAGWLGQLLPAHEARPILAALRGEPLAELRGRICDLLLLALIYPIAGLPASRAQLYEQAYALAGPLLEGEGELRAARIGRAALRHYRLARSLAGGADLAILADLPAHERQAVAPLAAGLLDNPSPVLDLLWGGDDGPGPADLRGLTACLRERPTAALDHGLRLIDRLITAGPAELLAELAPAIPTMLAAAARDNLARATQTLGDLARRWPGELAPSDLNRLLGALLGERAAPELGWAAADLLARREPAPGDLPEPAPGASSAELAARCYVIAMARPAERPQLLAPGLLGGLEALLCGEHGDERRALAAAALLDDGGAPAELRALALAARPAPGAGDELIGRALADASPALRRSAIAGLAERDPQQALALLGQVLLNPTADEVARAELLAVAAAMPQPAATGLLARCALATQLGLLARLSALRLLSDRPGAALVLRKLVAADGQPAILRATAAIGLGRAGDAAAIPALRTLALSDDRPLLRRGAIAALARLACGKAERDAAIASLIAALARPDLDCALTARAAAGLGAAGAAAAVPALAALLGPQRGEALHQAWLAAAPQLAACPAEGWDKLDLPEAVRVALLDSLASGDTLADRPSSLGELAARQAEAVALAAAEALAAIARASRGLAPRICARLRLALPSVTRPQALAGLLDALARAAGDTAGTELEAILDSPASSMALRWSAVDRIGRAPAQAGTLLARLQAARDDRFTLGKLAELLGELGAEAATPALRAIAGAPDGDPHLRSCAIAALGRLATPAATAALRQIAGDRAVPTGIRQAALAALPSPLDQETRQALRQILRAGGGPELASALARALAHAGERDVLPLLLRCAESERAAELLAAIDALAALGDPSTSPVLVRISQRALAAPGVRLAAVEALLQIGGREHLPLLRSYLDAPSLPLRLQAHAALARLDPDDQRLLDPLAEVDAPLALRLHALERLSASAPEHSLLAHILGSPAEAPQLRLRAAEVLGRRHDDAAAQALLAALEVAGPPLLRRRCIVALAAHGRPDSRAARAGLAARAGDPAAPAEERHWAAEALLSAA